MTNLLEYLIYGPIPLFLEENVLEEKAKSPFQKLQDNKVELTPEEKALAKDKKAVWGDGRMAVWKSVHPDTKNVTYITHTHRAYNTAPTLKGAIGRFHKFIKTTA